MEGPVEDQVRRGVQVKRPDHVERTGREARALQGRHQEVPRNAGKRGAKVEEEDGPILLLERRDHRLTLQLHHMSQH